MSNYRIIYKETLEHADNNDYSRRLKNAVTNLASSLTISQIPIPGTELVYNFDIQNAFRDASFITDQYDSGDYAQLAKDAEQLKNDMKEVLRRNNHDVYTKDLHESARAVINYADEIINIVNEIDLEKRSSKKRR